MNEIVASRVGPVGAIANVLCRSIADPCRYARAATATGKGMKSASGTKQ
jgi:hypothetical protein